LVAHLDGNRNSTSPIARGMASDRADDKDEHVDVGDEWIYRARAYSPSERVKIVSIEKRKQTTRVDIEFLDGDKVGTRDNVPATRLPRPWSEVTAYHDLMANWQRLGDCSLDEAEEWAVEEVFSLLIPESVATYYDSFVKNGATVRDIVALERIMRRPLLDIMEQVEWFDHDGAIQLCANGTLLVAEYACRANPLPVLDNVIVSEAEVREHCKRGRTYQAVDGSGDKTSSPEWEYESYRKRLRPVHELLRQWCGHRSVTFYERLTAAEAENRRLDILVAKLIDRLKHHEDAINADIYEREHNEQRITPDTVRPVVDRPLAPWELPVRKIPTPRRRWW
jgi:hypothetical protein